MEFRGRIAIALAVALATVAACEWGRDAPSQDGAAKAPMTVTTNEDPLLEAARLRFEPVPAPEVVLRERGIPVARVELGRNLYMDPRLSASWVISCNSCHNLALGGVDMEETSIGHGWAKGPRNAPTVLNSVFHTAQFWDGRAKDLEEQAKGPIQAGVEMGSTPERTVRTLETIPGYVAMFREAFPGEADPVTFDNMARAIEAFESTLVTPGAPFDRWLEGHAGALSERERHGVEVFMESGCAACHQGVALGGQAYYPFGVVEKPGAEILPPEDKGRFAVTRTEGDAYVFKAPSLRNIELTAPYFHSGTVWELERAVEVMGAAQLGRELAPGERDAIVAFLRSLTGEQPRVEVPILPPHTDETPRPDPGTG